MFSSWHSCHWGDVALGYHRLFLAFSFVTFLALCSLSTVSNSFYLLLLFSILLKLISRSVLTESPHHILGLPRLLFPSTFWASKEISSPVFHLPFFPHDQPISAYSSPIVLKPFLHSDLCMGLVSFSWYLHSMVRHQYYREP